MQPNDSGSTAAPTAMLIDTLNALQESCKALKKPLKMKPAKTYDDGRLLPGETGYCAWCRAEFTPKRLYSKPQFFCSPFCNHTWHNHQNALLMGLLLKQNALPLNNGQKKALQIDAERALHGVHRGSGLKASDMVRIKSTESIPGCMNHKANG